MNINKTRILRGLVYRLSRFFPDRTYLEILFKLRTGYPLNLEHPRTFNEKMQWLKLNDHRPIYQQMADKVEAKKYVGKIIGEDYIIPTLAVYDSVNDIEFDTLPHQFVLKCTHDSGTVFVCKDKDHLDKTAVVKLFRKALKKNYYPYNREWPYKHIRPRIIAEKYMENPGYKELVDYKIYCFHGKPMYCQVVSDRRTRKSMDFFDCNWNHQSFHKSKEYPFALNTPSRPENYAQMLELASRLSKGIIFVRVDLYEISGKVYFGELTFYPASGMGGFSPMEWDYKFGDLIHLPIEE